MRSARACIVGMTIGACALAAVGLTDCAGATAIDVEVYSEVPCATNAEVALTVADDPTQLAGRAASSSATRCDAVGDGTFRRGNVVIVPQGDKDKLVAFELTTRNDGQPASTCNTANATGCIFARRQLRFLPHEVQSVRVDLRLSCLDVKCGANETCVKGACVSSDIVGACSAGCDETNLGTDGGVPDAGPKDVGTDAPPDVVEAGTTTILLGAGSLHACAFVSPPGTLKCWGFNGSGRLGDGTTTQRTSPTPLTLTGIQQISPRSEGTCILQTNGIVRCWGANGSGAVGDGTFVDRASPVEVSLPLTATALGVGSIARHVCAVLQDRSIRCWGSNDNGQLGDGTLTNRSSPVVPMIANVSAIAVGYDFTCALQVGGTVQCWGSNATGQLGDGTTTDRTSPVTVNLGGAAKAIAAGSDSTCALLSTGVLKCWGDNAHGQLGDGTTTNRSLPVTVTAAGTKGVEIAMSALNTCLRRNDGITCWGENASGQVGDGTRTKRLLPADVLALGGSPLQLVTGTALTCAVVSPAPSAPPIVRCWGSNANGQLGIGSLAPVDTVAPTTVLGL